MAKGGTRGHARPRGRREIQGQGVALERLGTFTYSIKQGDRKRNKRRTSDRSSNDAESGSEVRPSNDSYAPSLSTNAETGEEGLLQCRDEGRINAVPPSSNHRNIEKSKADEEKIAREKGKEAAPRHIVNSPETRTLANLVVVGAPVQHLQHPQQHHHRSTSSSSDDDLPPFVTRVDKILGLLHHPQPQRPPICPAFLHSREYSRGSSIDSTPVKGQNDYSVIQQSPQGQAQFDTMMNNLGRSLFDVQEWDPELPSAPDDPDASPERLTVKSQPIAYTTVGSVVKSTDTRQFTAPNRIQREGRVGLEVAGRRPIASTATPSSRGQDRGQEFFSERNAPQYQSAQSYSQVAAQNSMHEQSSAGQYQLPQQHGFHSYTQGQSSTGPHPSQQVGGQSFAYDQSSAASHTLPPFGAPNYMQDQPTHQGLAQQQSSMGQNVGSHSSSLYQPQLQRQAFAEQSSGNNSLTPQEESVFKSLNLPLPMISTSSIEKNPLSNAGRPFPEELTPTQSEMLAQLHAVKPQEQSRMIPGASAGTSATNMFTAQRPNLGVNHEASMPPSSSTSSAARLQDAKMSTVQRLAQFPNPDQERAKARLAELSASRMGSYQETNENQRPGPNDQSTDSDHQNLTQSGKEMIMRVDASHEGRRGGDGGVASRYQGNRADSGLNYGYRFPNPSANPLQQNHASAGGSSYSAKTVVGPRMTPQGYPQPLTAGPPGQRQNIAPSSNKALNSMQQMVANGNQRNPNPYQQYGQPQHAMQPMQSQFSFASQPPSQQQPAPTQFSFASQPPSQQQPSVEPKIIPDPATYPWAKLDQQPRDFTDGAPPRVRESVSYQDAMKYYPNGMDMDTIRSFITTLSPEEAAKHYPAGMDESTKKWYEEERKWQQRPASDLGLLLNGTVPFKEWIKPSTFRRRNNFNGPHGSDSGISDPTDLWFHSGLGKPSLTKKQESAEKDAESSGPGIIGQPRPNAPATVDESNDQKRLTLDEIKAMPLPVATEHLLTNVFANLRKYSDRTPEGIANLQARGWGPVPEHARDTRPNRTSLFGSVRSGVTTPNPIGSDSGYRPSSRQPSTTHREKGKEVDNEQASSSGNGGR